jgi:drug/metabolite transporter (DMT)-like permease
MSDREHGGEAISPESLAMIRMVGGAIFFQLAALLFGRGAPIPRVDHVRIMGLSLLGISLNQALFLAGLRLTTPFAVALLCATIPVFSAALAVLFRKEPFVARTALGLGLAVGGVLSLTGFRAIDRGAILVALNSLSYSAYVVLSRDVVLRTGALRLMAWLFTYGAIAFAPIGVGPMIAQLPELTTRGALYVAYIVAVPTILAYALNAWALGRSSASVVTIYITTQPLVAALLARVQLGHTIAPRAALAAVLIAAGLGLVATRRARPV